MFTVGYNLMMLVRVAAIYLVMYIAVPWLLVRDRRWGIMDRIFVSLIHSTFLTIVIVHLLVFVKLYETLSLIVMYLIAWVILAATRGGSFTAMLDILGMRLIVRLLDLSESPLGFIAEAKRIALQKAHAWLQGIRYHTKILWSEPFTYLLPALALIAATATRASYSVMHASYSVSDPYEHLAWAKYLGLNQIYYDGIYPHGYHAVLSAMARLSLVDAYWICRFMGPIGSVFLVLSIYYFATRMTGSRTASLVALVSYGLINDDRYPSGILRQAAALPQEYALIFALPALYFLYLYFRDGNKTDLWLFTEAVTITVFIHPFTTIYLGLWAAVMGGSVLLTQTTTLRAVINAGGVGLAAIIFGFTPFAFGLLQGHGFFQAAFQFVGESFTGGGAGPTAGPWFRRWLLSNPYLDSIIPLVVACAFLILLLRQRGKLVGAVTVLGGTVVLYILYRAQDLGLPQFTHPSRTSAFLAPMLAVLYALTVSLLSLVMAGRLRQPAARVWGHRLTIGISLVVCVVVALQWQPIIPALDTMEYDAAAENYLRIKSDLPALDWTIIGPAEQYQQVVGVGWHVDLLRFVQQYTWEQASDPAFQLPIPTHHILVYAEKRPLLLGRPVSPADAELELEPEGPDPFTQYYRNPNQRAIIQAKIIRWMELYRQSHPGVSTYYEDENLRIYHIQHTLPNDQGGS